MKTKGLIYILSGLFFLLLAGCNKDETVIVADSLNKLNWSDRNYEVINQLITDYGKGGIFYDEDKPPYVVLDWDQTCAHFDAEEATMRYQLTNLKFAVTKDQFKNDILKDNINGVTKLSEAYHSVVLADINKDLVNEYNYIYDNYLAPGAPMTLSQIQATPQYLDFLVKIPFLYDGYCDTPGIEADYGYPWVLYLFAGYTNVEVKAIANDAIAYELGNKLAKLSWTSPAGYVSFSGPLSYSYKTGLRVLPEMQNLISTFTSRGIEVYIVSASYKPVVEVFSGSGNFGYNVPAGNVIAMELATNANGKIMSEYKAGWIKTQRQGKVDAINRVIKQELGKNWDPLFSACDSDGDYEMSTAYPDMKLTLIWNRVKGGDIGKLCKQAVDEADKPNPRYILQGRNENTGMAIPRSESILLGKTQLQLLYP